MKKENGITMLVLVFTVVILLIVMSISFSVMTGDNGMMKKTSNTAFEQKISQIKDGIDEKTSLYQLEGITAADGNRLLTKSVRLAILQEFYDFDNPANSRINIMCENVGSTAEAIYVVKFYYKDTAFSEDQKKIMKNYGGQPMDGKQDFMYNN